MGERKRREEEAAAGEALRQITSADPDTTKCFRAGQPPGPALFRRLRAVGAAPEGVAGCPCWLQVRSGRERTEMPHRDAADGRRGVL